MSLCSSSELCILNLSASSPVQLVSIVFILNIDVVYKYIYVVRLYNVMTNGVPCLNTVIRPGQAGSERLLMGSVLALSSRPERQNSPFPQDRPLSRWDKRDGRLPNPGSFDGLHRSCKDVFPQQVEGVKMVINKTLSSFFKVSHTFHISAVAPSTYRFHVEHLQSDTDSKDTGSPMLIGEMDSSGSLNAHSLFHLSERIRAKAVFQTVQSQFVTWQFETEYRGADFTAAVTMANPDIFRESVIMVAHFLQSVSPQLVLGGELVYHRGRAEEGGILTLAGQYSGRNWVATLNAGKGGAHASYYHRANKQIQVGVEFEASTRTQETKFSFGYQMDLPRANMTFRGMLDSRCIIGGVLEKRLCPLPATLIMGAFVNHRGDKLQVGLGVNVG
ncbi:mitochondrial import receptor subunit TOM40B isoform 1-T1 [Clarias gariepinus]|uniref:mitochondrial import receptor subunit TOM40B isoform X1 n=2 Tax=Clarias gariepinus TaxID=13013 RepID=UPI00234C1665|nr:mitochondrial import receptor subunit TOM40B isoform X1 [Clarias gariepinus]